MYNDLMVRPTACEDEKFFVNKYNEYVRRYNAKLSTAYIKKAWNEVVSAYEFYSMSGAEWLRFFSICLKNKWVRFITPKSRQVTGIEWECQPIERDCEQLYLIDLLNAHGDRVWMKVGTTTRSTFKRMEEHLKYYAKYGITSIRVRRVWECDTNAEGFESFFRSYYIRKYPGTFQKNDRFFQVEVDLDEADRLFTAYQGFSQI